MIREAVKSFVPEITLREDEITVGEAVRRLEVPLYGVVSAGARLLGWRYDLTNLDTITHPRTIGNSLAIKYGIPLALGMLYLAQPDSQAREKFSQLVCKTAEVSKKLIKGGQPRTRRRLLKDMVLKTSMHFDHTGNVPYGLQLAEKGVKTNVKIARWGFGMVKNIARLGLRSSGEVMDIGSRIWFVNRGLHALDPLVTVHAPDEFEEHVSGCVELPASWKATGARFRRVH